MNFMLTCYWVLISGMLTASSLAYAQPSKPKEVRMAYYCEPCGSSCDEEAHASPGICPHCGMPLVKRSVSLMDSLTKTRAQTRSRNVAIFIHNGVEILDLSGPSEVFAATKGFNVYTVGLTKEPIRSQGFITITPTYALSDCPKPDIVVLPGGQTNLVLGNKDLIDWIKRSADQAEVMLSVCTGAGLLAKAGLLDGRQATTFHNYIETLQRDTPRAKILRNTRFVDNGQIITTAGVSAGIDGALHVVAKLKGLEVARQTAYYMEYDKWVPNEGLVIDTTSSQTTGHK